MARAGWFKTEAGRQITIAGVVIAEVKSLVQTGDKNGLRPVEADQFARELSKILNRVYRDPAAFARMLAQWRK